MNQNYTPNINSSCTPHITDANLNTLLSKVTDWDDLNVWNGNDIKQDILDKYLTIVSLLEYYNYPDDLSHISSLIGNKSLTVDTINYSENKLNSIQFKKYTLEPNNVFSIATKFNYDDYILNGTDYSSEFRGNEYVKSLLDNSDAGSPIMFGTTNKAIPVLSLLSKYPDTDALVVLLNPVNIVLKDKTLNSIGKKIEVYNHNPSGYRFPTQTQTKTDVVNDLIPFTDNQDNKVNLTTYHLNSDFNCINTYDNMFSYMLKHESTGDDCETLFKLPTTIKIPSDFSDPIQLKACAYIMMQGLDTSKISNYNKDYTDLDNRIIGLKSTDDNYYIFIYDSFMDEPNIDPQTTTTIINSKVPFNVFNQINENFNTIIDTLDNELAIPNNANTKVIIYSFGHRIYSFLRDFNTKYPAIVPKLYVEGLGAVTVGFTNFETNYNVGDYKVVNIWQDSIVNTMTHFDDSTHLDNIQVTELYDINKDQNYLNCIHSMYAYAMQ